MKKVKSIVLVVVIIISVLATETVSHRMDHDWGQFFVVLFIA